MSNNSGPDKKGKTDLTRVCLIDSIPGEDDADGVAVLVDGSLRSYIKCEGVNALLFDENDRETLARTFASFANTCESDVQIIVRSRALSVDDFLSSRQSNVNAEDDYLKWYADYTDKWFRRVQDVHFIPQRDFYVVVTYQPPDREGGTTASQPLASAKHPLKGDLQALGRLTKTACEQLRASYLQPKIMDRKQVRNLIYSELNPALVKREPEAPPSVDDATESSILAASALKVSEEYIWLDGRFIATQYLRQLPRETWMGWLTDLLTLSIEYTLSMFIHQCEQDKDRELSMYITSSAETRERLAQNTDEIRRVFKSRNAILDRAQLSQLSAWQSTLPVAVDKLKAVHRIKSSRVGTFWPFFTAACGTPDGTPFGFAIASREPVLLNPFFRGAGKDANNMLVIGSAGAGKSFALSMLFLRLLPLGTRFVVVDKTVDQSGGYRFMTDILGPKLASYVDLGQSPDVILNPFDLSAEDKPGKPSSEKISSLLSLFDLMLAPEGENEITLQEKALLDGLIRKTYTEANARDTVPTMSDLSETAARAATDEADPHQRDQLSALARNISLFTKQGSFARLLDGKTSFDVEIPFLVFDTRELNEPRLERIAQYLTVEFIRRRAADYKKRGVKFASVIDQADTWMRSRTGAQLLDRLSRQSRQYGMMLVCVAQQLKDLLTQSESSDSVVKNAHIKLILRQDASELRQLKETLQLSDAEVHAVQNFSRDEVKRRDSQCLLMVGSTHGTIRLVPSPMDYWICTSEPTHDIPKRAEKFEEIREQDPRLNRTDAARRSVYYLGFEAEN